MRPNLLFIFTDQQRPDTLAAYGNTFVHAPNLNRLAESGTVVENSYVTQPVCTPSRASIMTGLYPHTHGCTENNLALPAGIATLAERVALDIRRAYMGKWHLGDEIIAQHGFETWVSTEDNYRKHYSRPEYAERFSDYHHYLVSQGFEPQVDKTGRRMFSRTMAARLPEKHTKARFTGRAAADFIRASAGQPWMLYVNFLEPHPPYYGPDDDRYPPDELPVGPEFLRAPGADAPLVNRLKAERYANTHDEDGQDLTTEAGWRKTRAKYLGLVSLVDRAVGDILQALEESGQADKTLVVFTSDHGDMMGDHGLLGKGVRHEMSVRVPLIFRAPWLEKAPRRLAQPLSQIDLVPTLLELLDQPPAPELPGRSRAAELAGTAPEAGQDVFIEWNGAISPTKIKHPQGMAELTDRERARMFSPWRTIVTPGGWKLNLSPVDVGELYDLKADPHELNNQFNDPAQRGRVREMTAHIAAWQARTGDALGLPVL